MKHILILLLLLTLCHSMVNATTLAAYYPETIAHKKFEPITGMLRAVWVPTEGVSKLMPSKLKKYAYEVKAKSVKYEVMKKCLHGFSKNNFGVCEPICDSRRCNELEECLGPNVCSCKRGYTAVVDDGNNATCAPICAEGCGQHAHCQAPNLCACDEAYVSNSSATTGDASCQHRCRKGMLWDSMSLECVEKQEANVTVIAAEIDLFMPVLETKQLEDINEGAGDGQLDGFVDVTVAPSSTSEQAESKQSNTPCSILVHTLIGLSVVMFLLTFTAVALYILKRRQYNNGDVILEDKNDLPGEYFIDRSQILVY